MGVKKGDRVLIYMPLIPEAIMAMLATARLGAVHSVVFGGKFKKIHFPGTDMKRKLPWRLNFNNVDIKVV